MMQIREVIVVEGRYDKNTISQLVDATVVETAGFGIFSNEEKLKMLRALAEKRGLIILTDSDGAGFVIRNYLKGALPKDKVKHAYIPDVYGKEHRKRQAGREGKLGVEGMEREVILRALRLAGATFEEETKSDVVQRKIRKTDLYAHGLSGGKESARRRRELLKQLDLPEHISANALVDVFNALFTYEEYEQAVSELK